jgi:hypothetical protein
MKKIDAKKSETKTDRDRVKPAKPAKSPSVVEPAPAQPVKAPKGKRPKAATGSKRLSGLDAAAKVLADAKEPLRCADLTKRVLDRGLWKTSGKTPAATLNAAIIREIRGKGGKSRFRKAGRGLFAATGKGG